MDKLTSNTSSAIGYTSHNLTASTPIPVLTLRPSLMNWSVLQSIIGKPFDLEGRALSKMLHNLQWVMPVNLSPLG